MERWRVRGPAIVLAAALLAFGCASAKVTEWTGHHVDEVIKKFGTPSRIVEAAAGAKMYVFEFQRSVAEPSWGAGGNVQANERRCTGTRNFLVRPDGIVASWTLNDCTP